MLMNKNTRHDHQQKKTGATQGLSAINGTHAAQKGKVCSVMDCEFNEHVDMFSAKADVCIAKL